MILGLDVGGTHTDVVLLDKKGLQKEVKVPTDASDLFNYDEADRRQFDGIYLQDRTEDLYLDGQN